MFYQHLNYLKFLAKSTNEHGVHSPFVFELTTTCFYTKTNKTVFNTYKTIKEKLIHNKEFIEITDFGAGSKIFKSNKRQIAKIAKIAGIPNKKAKLLIRFIHYFKPKTVLEIGTSLGLATTAIHLGNKNAKITTLEGCVNTAKVASENFNYFNLKNIEIKTGNFDDTILKVIKNTKFDLIYFDGNHTKKATLAYFEKCLSSIHNESIFIFDDIHWSKEMSQAWKIIKNHPKVRVTIDTFFWGIVFFRKEQVKEHFTIRV